MFPFYDVIVIGAGHAGCEAAVAAARLGSRTLLITMNLNTIGQMSCNPAMGGIAKGQIIREIDALGGNSGIVTDESMLQFRMLNRSKGVAVWSPRAQNDRMLFALRWRELIEQTTNVDLLQDNVQSLILKGNQVQGVKTQWGSQIEGETVVLTAGTFLNGTIHIGKQQQRGGRISESSATGITEQLLTLGFQAERLKTGTPPRIDGRTINYAKMEEQKGDDVITGFSFKPTKKIKSTHQRSCYITYTNKRVHDTLRSGFQDSPMFSGLMEGAGPRYCPSIEDKINRFADRDRHQLFVEPEGFRTVEIYLNGFSTSLSQEVQLKALHQIAGLEACKMFRPGYAIEYDFFTPTQLHYSLETKRLRGLFFAGQINGTTGYEEAACQGLIAGINAHKLTQEQSPLVLKRNEAYVGVLIDDLITKGTQEPYRMFTSRAEFRTLLRQDNADLRLCGIGNQVGLIDDEQYERVEQKKTRIKELIKYISTTNALPESTNAVLKRLDSTPIKEKIKWNKLIRRPEIQVSDLRKESAEFRQLLDTYEQEEIEQAEIQLKYQVYIDREEQSVAKMKRLENLFIPNKFNYKKIKALSAEAMEKLIDAKPTTLGQASRISGISPADVAVLTVYLGR